MALNNQDKLKNISNALENLNNNKKQKILKSRTSSEKKRNLLNYFKKKNDSSPNTNQKLKTLNSKLLQNNHENINQKMTLSQIGRDHNILQVNQ